MKNTNRAGSAKKQMQRELSSALVVPCRYQDSQRNEGADRARRPDIFGIVSLTSRVLKKKNICRRRHGQSKKNYEPFLVTHALWRATRKGITDSNDATGKRNIVFFETSRTASLCRISGRRQSCAQMGRELVLSPQGVDEHTMSFDARADIPHTKHRIHEDFSLAVKLA